jgi:sec-independent protein translocase protein TatA
MVAFGSEPAAFAFQFGGFELIILLIIVAILLLFGPQKLPELARGIGRAWGEFRRGKMELEREIAKEMELGETEAKTRAEVRRVIAAAKELELEVEGVSERDLRLQIAQKIDTAERDAVLRAAKALQVATEGVELERVKQLVIKTLNV